MDEGLWVCRWMGVGELMAGLLDYSLLRTALVSYQQGQKDSQMQAAALTDQKRK